MLILPAGSALSEFRREKLLEMISGIEPTVVALDAHYFFLVETKGSLDASASDGLADLLGSEPVSSTESSRSPSCYAVPRLGTISPWSTKATDIVRRCGLLQVLRIERGIEWTLSTIAGATIQVTAQSVCGQLLHDPMVESLINKSPELARVFAVAEPGNLRFVDVLGSGRETLVEANEKWGLALSFDEVDFLLTQFQRMGRNPTDAELMMFAQVNSEHCRHKIFNANWKIDGVSQPHTLFSMIRSTHEKFGSTTLVAYNDNAAVIPAPSATWFGATGERDIYQYAIEPLHIVAKVETHNHPTAISPFPGAATGSGGEIRDEGATGRGAKPRAGLTGFSVSNLHLPGAAMPWEMTPRRPPRIASPLRIMIDGPLGGAAFNNEFGRPNIGGYFRTFEVADADGSQTRRRGYHKPIMLAGGIGNIREG
ncbi:MAG TPA: phosphoribosylformylglycinamidine synthase, partial [Gammaproteobacteria bacterium]|nr:phosphoribosylformylglycinamidine synthase [Gammaproteobacteria bacterium]